MANPSKPVKSFVPTPKAVEFPVDPTSADTGTPVPTANDTPVAEVPEIDLTPAAPKQEDAPGASEQPKDMESPVINVKKRVVKVATRIDHKCNIGGTWYYFKRGVPVPVPEEVRKILLDSGLLMAL